MRKLSQRTEAVIRLDSLTHNVKNICGRLHPGCQLMAVLKGDGYGHGIAGIYPALKAAGVLRYAVAIWEEGVALRNAGCNEPVLILGDTCDDMLEMVVKHRLIPTIFSVDTAEKLNRIATQAGVKQPVHIKIDTGMSRIGFPADDSCVEAVLRISKLDHIDIEGAFTHFAKADEPDGLSAAFQLKKYLQIMDKLEAAGIRIPMKHVSNSPAILLRPEAQLDAVRAGDILFALCPVDDELWAREDFQQVLCWYTQVAHVKTVPVGTQVGYGGTFTTRRTTKIATIPVGFADGYSRRLSNNGKVKIRGAYAPVIGRVCMDQFMVDVTDIPNVQRGDTVTLLDDDLSVLWMANMIDANVDEIVCGISKRVPRVYE